MKHILILTFLIVAACASNPGMVSNPKDIPMDTGAQPQDNVVVSAPPGTMGHGRF